ncbi:MAG TPA: hypothetical protein VF006_05105 [Longimicrobium sp.]
MTARHLYRAAAATAFAVQTAMVLTYGTITGWCFCSVTGTPPPPVPPLFVRRFLDLAVLPAAWMTQGLAVQLIFVQNVTIWFVAVLALLYGMALAARVRIRPARQTRGRRIGLVGQEHVRLWQMLLLGCVLIGMGMAGGAMARRRWLSQAEQVFAATIAAASADRPLPPRVEFSMYASRGDDRVYAPPEARYVLEVDPARSGDHFLDRFVVPYQYGGAVRCGSSRARDSTSASIGTMRTGGASGSISSRVAEGVSVFQKYRGLTS